MVERKKEIKDSFLKIRVKSSFKKEIFDFCDKNECSSAQIIRDLFRKYMDGKIKFIK